MDSTILFQLTFTFTCLTYRISEKKKKKKNQSYKQILKKKKKIRRDVNLILGNNIATLSNRPKTKNSSTDRTLNQLEIERLFAILLLCC